jgi:hypothetical protein
VGVASGATLRVPADFATINQALDASAAGDTVLVAPGVYTDFETRIFDAAFVSSCAFLKGGVTLRSEAGPGSTVIRLESTNGLPQVVFGRQLDSEMRVEGFSINGVFPNLTGIAISDCAKVFVRDCLFALEATQQQGGIGATRTELDVRDCRFSGFWFGVGHNDERLVVEDSLFENGQIGILCYRAFDTNYMSLTVRNSTFRNNTGASGSAGGISSGYDVTIVEDSWFADCGGIVNVQGGIYATGGSITVRGCTFVRNSVMGGRVGAGASLDGDTVEVSGNTFYRCTQVFSASGGAALEFRNLFNQGDYTFLNNVVVECETVGGGGGPPVTVGFGGTGVSDCNVFWENPGGTVEGLVSGPRDVEVDPLFCDPENDDFTVHANSHCLPEHSDTCELIGAHGLGCGVIAVEGESWGGIKAKYRTEGAGSWKEGRE